MIGFIDKHLLNILICYIDYLINITNTIITPQFNQSESLFSLLITTTTQHTEYLNITNAYLKYILNNITTILVPQRGPDVLVNNSTYLNTQTGFSQIIPVNINYDGLSAWFDVYFTENTTNTSADILSPMATFNFMQAFSSI